ncbi:MAG: matrixin family metalloprotease, partial [Acidobacteria bacterium]|nr:matrixin family metalloprotease [Acidobacteriota bacterium]
RTIMYQRPLRAIAWVLGFSLLATAEGEAQSLLHLKKRSETARLTGDDGAPRTFTRRTLDEQRLYRLVEFSARPTIDDIGDLKARGARVVAEVPDTGLIIVAPPDIDLGGLDLVQVEQMTADDKLSPEIDLTAARPEGDLLRPFRQPDPFLVQFHLDLDAASAARILDATRVRILSHPQLLNEHYLIEATPEQLIELAEWDEVAYIFPASTDLTDGAQVHVCSGALTGSGLAAGQQVNRVGDGWAPGRVPTTLQYGFGTLSAKVDNNRVKSEARRALDEWAKYIQVTFTEGTNLAAARTLAFRFGRGSTGVPQPFDGPGRTLAYAYYPSPPNPEPAAGDLYFDDDENWQFGGADIDVFSVVLHELGHSLGLGHSDATGDVMYPYYRRATALSAGDVAAIRTMYATRTAGGTPTPPTPPTTPVSNPVIRVDSATSSGTAASPAAIIRGTASHGSGITRVTWVNARGGSGTATGTTAWNTLVPLQTGDNQITLTALATAGTSASQVITVTLKAPETPVTLNITNPPTSTVTTAAVAVSGTAAHTGGIARVTWVNARGGSGTATGTTSWSTTIPLQAGENQISVTAVGTSGGTTAKSIVVTYRAPETPVTLSIVAPTAGRQVSSTTVAVTGTAAHPSGLARITWTNARGGSGTASGTSNWLATVPLQSGDNLITVTAVATGGGTVSRTVSVNFRPVDTTAPSLIIQTPGSSAVAATSSSLSVTGVATDNVAVTEVTWQNSTGGAGSAQGTANWRATIPLMVGVNTVTIRARDAAGNVGTRSMVVTRR